eukprot:76339-Pleurochrysis_carterae.AAC.3
MCAARTTSVVLVTRREAIAATAMQAESEIYLLAVRRVTSDERMPCLGSAWNGALHARKHLRGKSMKQSARVHVRRKV